MNAAFKLASGERKLRLGQTLERAFHLVEYLLHSNKVSLCTMAEVHVEEVRQELEIARSLVRNGIIKRAIEEARARAGEYL